MDVVPKEANNGPLFILRGQASTMTFGVSLRHTSVEIVTAVAQKLGAGALLAKINIKSAYRLVPVHPLDHPLLGVKWGGAYYICRRSIAFWPTISSVPKLVTPWLMRYS